MRKPAILFDMDGVLVDSEPVITKAAMQSLRQFGVIAEESDFKNFTGMGEDRFIGGVAEKYGVPYRMEMKKLAYQIYLELVDQELTVYPGLSDALEALRRFGSPMVLASSADRIKIDANLRVAGIPQDTFAAILSGDDVKRKKPFPDIYLAAADACGYLPSDCFVVEDALSGIQAGKAAGCYCVGIPTSFSPEALKDSGADWIAESVRQLPKIVQDFWHA